jgi:hypothetical protein
MEELVKLKTSGWGIPAGGEPNIEKNMAPS